MVPEPLEAKDLAAVAALQPEGWLPVLPYYSFYLLHRKCFPVKFTDNRKLIGIGTLILHAGSGWFAHIIVHPAYRRTGIGTAITRSLMDVASKHACKTLSLVSTPLGESVYKNLGFRTETTYSFLRGTKITARTGTRLTLMHSALITQALALDKSVSGEDRSSILSAYWKGALCVVENNTLTGFYLPTLGEGLIAASDPAAGLELMAAKHASRTLGVIPFENREALSFLQRNGYSEFRKGARMIHGNPLVWLPSNVYGRIGGHLG